MLAVCAGLQLLRKEPTGHESSYSRLLRTATASLVLGVFCFQAMARLQESLQAHGHHVKSGRSLLHHTDCAWKPRCTACAVDTAKTQAPPPATGFSMQPAHDMDPKHRHRENPHPYCSVSKTSGHVPNLPDFRSVRQHLCTARIC